MLVSINVIIIYLKLDICVAYNNAIDSQIHLHFDS